MNTSKTILDAISEFLAVCKVRTDAYMQAMKFSPHQMYTFRVEYGQKFARIVKIHNLQATSGDYQEGQSSAFGFVALVDGSTKALGSFKAGDIFKTATWAAPAKQVRGSVLSASHGAESLEASGANIRYLR